MSSNETEIKILDATVRTLIERRGHGVRMSDIAQAAGVSRQALYLHFSSRSDLLIATTQYLDKVLDLESRLAPSRNANSGEERLKLYIDFWGSYVPEIYGVSKGLLLAQDLDDSASAAWNDRMQALRMGCYAAIVRLNAEGKLAKEWTEETATDALWTMMLVPNWENLVTNCNWSPEQYTHWLQTMAHRTFIIQPGEV